MEKNVLLMREFQVLEAGELKEQLENSLHFPKHSSQATSCSASVEDWLFQLCPHLKTGWSHMRAMGALNVCLDFKGERYGISPSHIKKKTKTKKQLYLFLVQSSKSL